MNTRYLYRQDYVRGVKVRDSGLSVVGVEYSGFLIRDATLKPNASEASDPWTTVRFSARMVTDSGHNSPDCLDDGGAFPVELPFDLKRTSSIVNYD